jgi:hypothetical protein
MLLTLIVLIFIILYFLMCKKEKFTEVTATDGPVDIDAHVQPPEALVDPDHGALRAEMLPSRVPFRYDENIFFGLDKDKDSMYQLDLKLSKAKHLQKLIENLEKNKDIVIKDNTGEMILNNSCIPKEPKFVIQSNGYGEFSALNINNNEHLKNYEFKNLIDHLYKP